MCVATVWNCFYLFDVCGIHSWDVHVVLGTIAMIIDVVLLISGVGSYYYVNWYDDPTWEAPKTKAFINKLHWYIGYFTIFFNLVVCFGGSLTYASKFLQDPLLARTTIVAGAVFLIV